MHKRSTFLYVVLLVASDLVATGVALNLATRARLLLPYGKPLQPGGIPNLRTYVLVSLVLLVFLWRFRCYHPRRIFRIADEFQNVVLAVAAAVLIVAGVLFFANREVSRLLIIYFVVLEALLLLAFRSGWRLLYKFLRLPRVAQTRVLVAGAGELGRDVAAMITQRRWMGLEMAGFLDDDPAKLGRQVDGFPVLGTLADGPQIARRTQVGEVVFTLPLRSHARVEEIVPLFQEMPIGIKVLPDFFPLAYLRTSFETFGGMPLIVLKKPVITGWQAVAKRALDLVLAGLLLILVSPLLMLIAILILVDSPGPIIFRQERVGENGRLFWMYKFRTMVVDAEAMLIEQAQHDESVLIKRQDDPRVTRAGRWLRRLSLDELPQLWNVIRGEMSLVGPRPELPYMVERYESWQRKRFAVPQGVTGWWQINGRSDKPMHLHTEDDLYYIQNYSLFLDLQILWKTVWAVVRGKGAY